MKLNCKQTEDSKETWLNPAHVTFMELMDDVDEDNEYRLSIYFKTGLSWSYYYDTKEDRREDVRLITKQWER